MNILIIGCSSFIGMALGPYLSAAGHTVCGTFKSMAFRTVQCGWLTQKFHYELGGSIEQTMFDDVDLVLHLAHDFRPGTSGITTRGTKELYGTAKQMGVDRQLFFSSCSARPDALSEYGQTKHALEGFFRERNGTIVRPGLVLGQGGLYKRMVGLLQKLPLIPLPDHGGMMVPVIDEQTLCQAVAAIIGAPRTDSAPYKLFHPEQVTLKRLLRLTATVLGRQPLFVPLPCRLFMMPLIGLARLGIPTPLSVDNLKGLMMNRGAAEHSDLDKTGSNLPAVDLMIRKAAAQFLAP